MDLSSQIHVFNRNGTYYFHRRVPKDLLGLYRSGKIIFSLKTKERKEAERLARIESVGIGNQSRDAYHGHIRFKNPPKYRFEK